jgi:hypothetical protein
MLRQTGRWQRLDSRPWDKGQPIWMGNVVLTQTSPHPTHLGLYWQRGEKKPWLLATNLRDPRATLRLYRRRRWIEEMFGDLKKHGFDLEASHLRHFLRLARLTLAGCLLDLGLVAMAEHGVLSRHAHAVDRRDRRDLSLFRLGWDFVERRLARFDPIPPVALPSFCLPLPRSLSNLCSVSGG